MWLVGLSVETFVEIVLFRGTNLDLDSLALNESVLLLSLAGLWLVGFNSVLLQFVGLCFICYIV